MVEDEPTATFRERLQRYLKRGLDEKSAEAVVRGTLTFSEALERMALDAEVTKLMRRHDLPRDIATQVVLGQADLDRFVQRRALKAYRQAQHERSCLHNAHHRAVAIAVALLGFEVLQGPIDKVTSYGFVLAGRDVHKLEAKYACEAKQRSRVEKALRWDEKHKAAPQRPGERPQDRYGRPDWLLFEWLQSSQAVYVTLVEGECFTGTVSWFSRYEIGLEFSKGSSLTIFRHAIVLMKPT